MTVCSKSCGAVALFFEKIDWNKCHFSNIMPNAIIPPKGLVILILRQKIEIELINITRTVPITISPPHRINIDAPSHVNTSNNVTVKVTATGLGQPLAEVPVSLKAMSHGMPVLLISPSQKRMQKIQKNHDYHSAEQFSF
ncbi:hypothetical protein [Zooshikella harenae]|uniref:Uncharacterized protein n=1 Tax=Zooshikella harenae TaxID=2827238 RepID=A0ABS5ZLE2_9GAMM|nr:hypothetical protein [Zooshikella harenae]MBU2713952.1 hypothetical protein [Zooshikella harenae]